MVLSKSERFIRELFAIAEIEVNGPKPTDIQVHNTDF